MEPAFRGVAVVALAPARRVWRGPDAPEPGRPLRPRCLVTQPRRSRARRGQSGRPKLALRHIAYSRRPRSRRIGRAVLVVEEPKDDAHRCPFAWSLQAIEKLMS